MTKNDQDYSVYRTGDIVVGSSDPNKSVYSSSGAKIIPQGVTIYGDPEDLEAQAEELTNIALRHGGKKINTGQKKVAEKTFKNKTKTKKTPSFSEIGQYSPYIPPEPVTVEPKAVTIPIRPQTVQFENAFGKIKVKVDSLIEHEQAYLLAFLDGDSLVFEPKVGEPLKLHTRYGAEEVYYPGVIFNSPEETSKFMLLFKVPSENQE